MIYTNDNTANQRSEKAIREQCNILFTCVGRRTALIRAFREALAELDVDGRIVGTDITDTSPAFHTLDVGEHVPAAGRREYVPSLLNIVHKHNIRLLVPLTDNDLPILSRTRDQFAALGCTVMVGSEESVAMCTNKTLTANMIRKAGLPAVKTCMVTQFRKQPFFPCFAKPVQGSAGIGAAVIHEMAQLDGHCAKFGKDMMLQEYLSGQEFTIDVYRTREGKVVCVVPRQRLVVRSGEVEKGMTVKDQGLIDAAVQLANKMGDIWGVVACQCRRASSEAPAKFFEINPRFGGGAPLAIAAGANLPLYLLQEVLGRPITARIGEFTDHLLMLRYDEAMFVPADDVETLPGFRTPMFR